MQKSRLFMLLGILFMALSGGILHAAWPFLFYPVTSFNVSLNEHLPYQKQPHAQAGIAERDITPPPGLPKFGYSAWAREADGFRTRLKARAFYLQGPDQAPLAIVQLDLGSGSLPLHHRVAELIEATGVTADRLSLLVTHTHSGPGQYLGSDFYNVFGSNRPGFDPALFEFLSQQIADAVIAAHANRKDARFATGQADLYGYTRNRSLEAWQNNFVTPPHSDAMQAVNPTMTMLRIDQREGDHFVPAGALSLYSIHGTAIPPFTAPYHADVWHWISQQLEQALVDRQPGFIHGAAQATHADNNPAWQEDLRGDKEAQRIGTALGNHAVQLFHQLESELSPTLITKTASRQLDLLEQTDSARFGLCERAITGAAVVGAANGDEVFPISWLPYFQEGWPRRLFTDHCQGVKQWMLSKLQLLLPAQAFPHQALLQVIQINDLVLVPLPWEITLESGNRIREAVMETLPADRPWKVEVSSLANGYFGYAVTPEEYQHQYYEGGHTLYGPHTLDFLMAQSARLSQDMQQQDINDIPAEQHFRLRTRQYFPAPTDAPLPERTWVGKPRYHSDDGLAGAYWEAQLVAEPPEQLRLNSPLLAAHCEDQIITDESGTLQLLDTGETHSSGHRYQVRWFPAQGGDTGLCKLAVHLPANPVKVRLSAALQ